MILGILLMSAALGVATFAVLSQAQEHAAVRDSFRRVSDLEITNERDLQLLAPLQSRTLGPMLRSVTSASRRLTPTGYVAHVGTKLQLAGRGTPETLDRYLAARLLLFAVVPGSAFVLLAAKPFKGLLALAVFGLVSAAALKAPDIVVSRWVAERQRQIRTALPDVLDLLTISVEAGLGFEQALDRTVARVPGPLSDEFARMLGETRAGASRADAMRAVHERTRVPELKSFVLAILQADTFGVSIGRVLRAQADEMRIKRRQLAQERAQKAPVKMLFPMVFCIFPAIFVVVIGPGMINVYEQFLGK